MKFELEQGMDVLARTPSVLVALLRGIGPEWHDATEGPETWSPYVVVGHLIHGERADWMTRAQQIIEQGEHRQFAPYDRFAQFRESEGRSLAQLLEEFATLRAANLQQLRDWRVTEEMLALTGEHPAFGTVTLRQLLATWVAHDLGHIAQVTRVMARQYRDDVGPWRAYLSIMDR